MKQLVSTLVLGLLLVPAAARPQATAETLRNAKTLFFDREYEEARDAWQQVRAAGGDEAGTALYWIARCSEKLGQSARALEEYGVYLDSRPADRGLAEEAGFAYKNIDDVSKAVDDLGVSHLVARFQPLANIKG